MHSLRKIKVVVYWAIISEICVLLEDCFKSHLPLPRNFVMGAKDRMESQNS